MNRSFRSQVDFETVLELVAAHARTGVGRAVVRALEPTATADSTRRLARLTLELEALLEDSGTLSLAGVDDAVPFLAPGSPPATEPRDLLHLLTLARRVATTRRQLSAAPAELELLHGIGRELPDTAPLVQWVAPRLGRDGRVPDEASPELARLRRHMTHLRQQLMSELEEVRRSHPDAATDAPPTLRRDRYCLPVRAAARGHLPGLVLDSSGSGATVFLEPFAVVELNNDLADSAAREGEEARRVLDEVVAAFAAQADRLRQALELLAELDAAQARALFGRRVEGRVVVPGEGLPLDLRGARHPLLDERLAELRRELLGEAEGRGEGHRVVALDLRLPARVGTLVISGPNAGGKTVVLKTVGLMLAMASCGIPLPVATGTTLPLFRQLWSHIGDDQDVTADLSTFSAAMTATAQLLGSAGEGTLVLYDELGAGTDPLEGAALACALLEELTRRGCLTIASTHLAAVSLEAGASDGMTGAAMGFDETAQRPTYSLSLGRPGRSRGLDIARAVGVPPALVERARELLGGQHLELDRWLARLEERERELEAERAAAAVERERLERLAAARDAERERLESERLALAEHLKAERERLRAAARARLDEALARLDEATREQRPVGRRQRQRWREAALELPAAGAAPAATETLTPGDPVRLASGGAGVLQEVRGAQALVLVAGKRLWVGRGDLQGAAGPVAAAPAEVVLSGASERVEELVLLGFDSESARDELERFLDRALANGQARVRVVHGHGTGALRRMVRQVCASHPAVRSYRHPPQHLGGTGATEIGLGGRDDEPL